MGLEQLIIAGKLLDRHTCLIIQKQVTHTYSARTAAGNRIRTLLLQTIIYTSWLPDESAVHVAHCRSSPHNDPPTNVPPIATPWNVA